MFGGPRVNPTPRPASSTASFLKEVDLNRRNPAVEAMHDVLRFWLERGVDGFRSDVIHRIAKDAALRDNPPAPGSLYTWGNQRHDHDENHPDIHAELRALRALADSYGERMLVGEIGLAPAEVATYYGDGDKLPSASTGVPHCPWMRASAPRSNSSSACSPPTPGPTSYSETTTSRATRRATTTPASATHARGSPP
jgi:glycosidase